MAIRSEGGRLRQQFAATFSTNLLSVAEIRVGGPHIRRLLCPKNHFLLLFVVCTLLAFTPLATANSSGTNQEILEPTGKPQMTPQLRMLQQEQERDAEENQEEGRSDQDPGFMDARLTRAGRPKGIKSKLSNDNQYNRLSRALERIHFGPFLRFRPFSNREYFRDKQTSGGDALMMNGYSARRRVSFPHSGESLPLGRRPIMRLRWGK